MPHVEQEPSLLPQRYEEMLRRRAPFFTLSADSAWNDLSRYLSELDRWRRSMNLTGALSAEELVDHALESILGLPLISHGARVIDVGSGAGFPGLPLAIQRSDVSMALSEPRAKRAAFLRHVVRELHLTNTRVLESRAEEVGGQTFDVATLRAVGDPSDWLRASPLLRPGGALLAWTTRPDVLAKRLSPVFRAETTVSVPGSRRRQIALFRRL